MPEKSKLLLHNPREWFARRPKRRSHPKQWRQRLGLIIPAIVCMGLVQWLALHQFMTEPRNLPIKLVLEEPLEYEFELPITAVIPPPQPELPVPKPKPEPEPAEPGQAGAQQSRAAGESAATPATAQASASAVTPSAANDASAQTTPVVPTMTPSTTPVAPSPLLDLDPPPPTPTATVNAPSISNAEPLSAQTEQIAEEQGRSVAGQGELAADVAPMRALADVEQTAPKPIVDINIDVPRRATYEAGGAPMPAEPLAVAPERVNPMRSTPNLAIEAPTAPTIPLNTPMAANPMRAPVNQTDIKRPRRTLAIERYLQKPAPSAIRAPAAAAEPMSAETDAKPTPLSKPALTVDRAPRPAIAISAQTLTPGAAERVLTADPTVTATNNRDLPTRAEIAGQQSVPSIRAPTQSGSESVVDGSETTAPAGPASASPNGAPTDPFASTQTGPVDLYGSATDAARAIAGNGLDDGANGSGRGRQRGFKKFNNPFADDAPNPLRGLRQREPQLFLDLAKYLVKTLGPGILGAAVGANEEIDDSVGVDAGPLFEKWLEAHHGDLKLECERRSDMPENVRRLLCQQ